MKKLWTLLLLPYAIFSASLEERVSMLEQEMGQVSTETANQTFGANFVPTNFQKGWIGLFIQGDILYWHPKVGGTEYAYKLIGNALKLPQSSDTDDHSFNWGWGARAALGITFPGIGWEFVGTGTWYSTSQTDTQTAGLPTILINLKGAFLAPSSKARSCYDLSYDEFLVELRRTYSISRFLSTYTSIGAKRNWVDQDQRLHYTVAPNQIYKVKDLCDFEGTGARLAFGTQWHLIYGLSFLMNGGGSLLYGKYEVKHTEILTPMSSIHLHGNTHLFSPQVDFSLGLGWDLYTKGYHFGISLNYEALYLWRQNQALQLDDTVQNRLQVVRYADDITFYGVTFKAKLEF